MDIVTYLLKFLSRNGYDLLCTHNEFNMISKQVNSSIA